MNFIKKRRRFYLESKSWFTKNLILTKYLALFLLLGALQSFTAVGYSQSVSISLDMNEVTIKEVLSEIEKKSGYYFTYNVKEINAGRKTSIHVKDKSITEVLDQLFLKNGVEYSVKDKYIVLFPSVREQESSEQGISRDSRNISGFVRDQKGEPIAGASVAIKGTSTGTFTDADGKYMIQAGQKQVLVFSFIGYDTKEIVVGTQTAQDVVLQESDVALEAVVVTALGITRAQKALSYNVQEVKNEDLTTVKDVNFMNALSGKVAGVNINPSSAGIGGAARVVMRGVKSISKDNNALYVIDGVPLFNVSGGAIDGNYAYADQPRGEGISDLNPDDIESISVLTGPSATALYGSSAANGVIVITTKKGEAGKPKITISNQLTFSKPVVYYKFQNKYAATSNRYRSWGEESKGLKGSRLDFFNTGLVNQTSASLSVGNEKNQTYASLAHSLSEGIIPENRYKKSNLTLRNTTSFLADKLTLDFGFSYIRQSDDNITGQGLYFNPVPIVYTFPVGSDLLAYKNFENYSQAEGFPIQNWPAEYESVLDSQNPYWLLNRMPRTNNRDRYMMNVNLKYKVSDWMSLAGRVRFDNSHSEQENKFYAGTISKFSDNPKTGKYRSVADDDKQAYADVILNVNKPFGNFNFNSVLGASFSDIKSVSKGMEGPLMVPNFFAMTNFEMSSSKTYPIHSGWNQQEQAVFASLEVGFKHMLYLTLTGRNDWSSALAKTSNQSFFYPSAGLSFLLSEAVKMPEQVSYMQLKSSYSSVGSPIPRNLSIVTYPYNDQSHSFSPNSFLPVSNLKPERTNSWEFGLSTKLFNNALNLDVTYYHSNTINQTLSLDISAMSLYSKMYVQAGNVRNRGIELAFGSNLKSGNISWNGTFTAGYNDNKILKLIDADATVDVEGSKISVGSMFRGERESVGASVFLLKEGGTMGDLYVKKRMKFEPDGNPSLDVTERYPILENTEDFAGSVLPKWNLGFRNSFLWKDFNFGFMISGRFGGIVMSPTEAILDGYGVTKATADARDSGGIRIGDVVFDAKDYYEITGSREGLLSNYVYKADNIRLQEVSLGYTFPKKIFKDKLKLNLSLVASNLWMIYKAAPFDPEMTASTGTFFQGVDFFMQPNTRNTGFSLKAEF
ncbi:SusC/RagA family TonB-linked outer membrane protein [Dysgonomonas sp.]